MGSLRATAQLPIDFPVTPFNLQATIKQVDYMIQRGELSGLGAGQAAAYIGLTLDGYAETETAPTAAYTGTGGSTTNYYAAVPEYPITEVAVGTIASDAANLMGPPLQGRGALGIMRQVRYGLPTTVTSVASCASALSNSNYVTVTCPTYSGQFVGGAPTWSIVKPDGYITVGGTFHVGDTINVTVGYTTAAGPVSETVSVATTAGMTNLAGVCAAVIAAIRADNVANPLVAVSTGTSLTTTIFFFVKNGSSVAGNVTLSVTVTGTGATTTAVASAATLSGGGVVSSLNASGAAVLDKGSAAISTASYPGWANLNAIWPPHCEVGVVPATAATITINFGSGSGTTFTGGAGQKITYMIGTQSGTYTTVSGDSTLAIALTSLAAAMQTTMRTGTGAGYTSGTCSAASGTSILITWGVTGTGGNNIPVNTENTTTPPGATLFGVAVPGVQNGKVDSLYGGIAQTVILGLRSAISYAGFGE